MERSDTMDVPEKPRTDKYFIVVIAATVLAFIFKLFLLSRRSPYIDPDEGYYLLLAQNLLSGRGYAFNGLPNVVMPPFLPFVIGFFYLAFRNFQFCLSIISALCGSLLGILIYFLARKRVLPVLALSASFLTLFIYQMNAFLPLAEPYVKNLYRGSDIINCLLVFLSLYFIILFVERGQALHAGWAGLFFALSYLTRPEGFILFIMVLICLCVLRLTSIIRVSYKKIALCLAVFILFAGPYIIYLKRVSGQWTLSGKVGSALSYRASLLKVIKDENWDSFRRYHYSLNPKTMEMNDTYFGFHLKSSQTQELSSSFALRNAWENLELYPLVPRILLPLYLAILTVFGLAFGLSRVFKKKDCLHLMLFILFPYSLAIAALSYPIPRHHLFLVPLGCFYSMIGLNLLFSHLPSLRKGLRKWILGTVLVLIGLWVIHDHIIKLSKYQLNIPEFKNSLAIEKQIGNYLKTKNPNVVMSLYPNLAIRSHSDWQVMPLAPLPQILRFAAHKKVNYIVLRPEKRLFYRIIDLTNSVPLARDGEEIELTIVEREPNFDLVIIKDPHDI